MFLNLCRSLLTFYISRSLPLLTVSFFLSFFACLYPFTHAKPYSFFSPDSFKHRSTYCQFQNLHLEIPRALSLKFRDTTLSNPDRAQTTCQKDPPSVPFPPPSFTCLQIHRSTSCCLRAFTLLFDTCFPRSCASTSLVFTLTLLLPCRALSQGHRGSRLGRRVGSDRDVDIVRKDFPSHLGAHLHSIGDSHSYKPRMSFGRLREEAECWETM